MTAAEAAARSQHQDCRACHNSGHCPICEGGSAGVLYLCAACLGANRCYMDCTASKRPEQLSLFDLAGAS